ncbi:hypothetical protein BBOV_II000980 [Babesia bovis T2Bo]|uniref:Uncharacterized protein n=1 Tax=Babesia bovis TaxID=5865 RepID=A7ASZ7_BABBO|nr:hypothetical protein BBOV_II000980 [Babesia bovis T2Bo]EDO06058.1 hypothetical protein BBOV_II000980 [Babesia bovis T2Bo]|eukprot:XP_001609626.1 hypothetical protein [Babesia bovis T2Bo]
MVLLRSRLLTNVDCNSTPSVRGVQNHTKRQSPSPIDNAKRCIHKDGSSDVHQVGAYTLRKRKRRVSVDVSSSDPASSMGITTLDIDDETRAWDAFYAGGRDSDVPFSGFDTAVTVKIIRSALKRIRPGAPIDREDVLLEVGHGKHPLIWDIQRIIGNCGFYTGIEFSSNSIIEAIKLRKRISATDDGKLGDNVEFLHANSVEYFNPDGSCAASVILPSGSQKPKLSPGTVSLVIAKSTLDYVTCRLTGSVDTVDWEAQPRISPSLVLMFDSFSIALGEANKQRPKALIFVEPDDFVKFRDHIATITRVIYAATFCNKSPAQSLRLTHIRRYKKHKAICYILEKTVLRYSDYRELRDDICKITARLYDISGSQDDDWLLPINVPPKWHSNCEGDLEQFSAIF